MIAGSHQNLSQIILARHSKFVLEFLIGIDFILL